MAPDASGDMIQQAWSEPKSLVVRAPTLTNKSLVIKLAAFRASKFSFLTAVVVLSSLVWSIVRYLLNIQGEDSVSREAFDQLAVSIRNSIKQKMTRDLVYQDMVANLWIIRPALKRSEFRTLTQSEAYAPGLKTISAMSLIHRVVGAAARQHLERSADEERLRQECCANATATGRTCSTVAATGLFCAASAQRYQITENGPDGALVPAVGDSEAYLRRVGSEEYMVVHYIEPFESNARVWGFNLLSSDARLQAWRRATADGKRTFTRRLNLVQGSGSEYGVLVWLPLFGKPSGEWTTAFHGNVSGLTPAASVNGVYFLQTLLTASLEETYSASQLRDIQIFLYDDSPELGGRAQYLAAYGVGTDPYNVYKDLSIDDAIKDSTHTQNIDFEVENANLKWKVIVAIGDEYNKERRTWNPEIALCIGIGLAVVSFGDRLLGHPRLVMQMRDTRLGDAQPAPGLGGMPFDASGAIQELQ